MLLLVLLNKYVRTQFCFTVGADILSRDVPSGLAKFDFNFMYPLVNLCFPFTSNEQIFALSLNIGNFIVLSSVYRHVYMYMYAHMYVLWLSLLKDLEVLFKG